MTNQLTVTSRTWLDGYDRDPPQLEVGLSDGSWLLLGWDSDYNFPSVLRAKDPHEEFESIPSSESGLHPDELAGLVDEVQRAVTQHDDEMRREWLDDAMSYSDGRES